MAENREDNTRSYYRLRCSSLDLKPQLTWDDPPPCEPKVALGDDATSVASDVVDTCDPAEHCELCVVSKIEFRLSVLPRYPGGGAGLTRKYVEMGAGPE